MKFLKFFSAKVMIKKNFLMGCFLFLLPFFNAKAEKIYGKSTEKILLEADQIIDIIEKSGENQTCYSLNGQWSEAKFRARLGFSSYWSAILNIFESWCFQNDILAIENRLARITRTLPRSCIACNLSNQKLVQCQNNKNSTDDICCRNKDLPELENFQKRIENLFLIFNKFKKFGTKMDGNITDIKVLELMVHYKINDFYDLNFEKSICPDERSFFSFHQTAAQMNKFFTRLNNLGKFGSALFNFSTFIFSGGQYSFWPQSNFKESIKNWWNQENSTTSTNSQLTARQSGEIEMMAWLKKNIANPVKSVFDFGNDNFFLSKNKKSFLQEVENLKEKIENSFQKEDVQIADDSSRESIFNSFFSIQKYFFRSIEDQKKMNLENAIKNQIGNDISKKLEIDVATLPIEIDSTTEKLQDASRFLQNLINRQG